MGYIYYRKGVSDLRHLRRASVAADGPGGLTALPLRHQRTISTPSRCSRSTHLSRADNHFIGRVVTNFDQMHEYNT